MAQKRTSPRTTAQKNKQSSKSAKLAKLAKAAKTKSLKPARLAQRDKKTKRRETSPCVVITGASTGIGFAFADYYAKTEAGERPLIIISSQDKKLSQAQQTLKQRYKKVVIHRYACDLTKPQAAQKVIAFCHKKKLTPQVLINNAGIGYMGHFTKMEISTLQKVTMLNMQSLTELSYYFLNHRQRKEDNGTLINIASTAAFQPMPYFALYAATKAFVLSLTDALAVESKSSNIQILAVCPGLTETDFLARATTISPQINASTLRSLNRKANVRTSNDVVTTTMNAVHQGKHGIIVDGFSNKTMINVTKFVPYRWRAAITATFFKNTLTE